MILEGGDTWTVEDNILAARGGSGRSQEPAGEGWSGADRTGLWRSRAGEENLDNTNNHLAGSSPEVLFQHAKLDDVAGVPDHRQDGDRVAAPDVAVQALSAVETKRAGHPQPRLQRHPKKCSLSPNERHKQGNKGTSCFFLLCLYSTCHALSMHLKWLHRK